MGWVSRRNRLIPVPLGAALVGLVALIVMDAMRRAFVDEPIPYTWPYYLGAGAFSLLLGLVLEASLRGDGYVPGNGETGETPDLDLRESHGFYWRS